MKVHTQIRECRQTQEVSHAEGFSGLGLYFGLVVKNSLRSGSRWSGGRAGEAVPSQREREFLSLFGPFKELSWHWFMMGIVLSAMLMIL